VTCGGIFNPIDAGRYCTGVATPVLAAFCVADDSRVIPISNRAANRAAKRSFYFRPGLRLGVFFGGFAKTKDLRTSAGDVEFAGGRGSCRAVIVNTHDRWTPLTPTVSRRERGKDGSAGASPSQDGTIKKAGAALEGHRSCDGKEEWIVSYCPG
jgi:hypothetical protein